MKVHTKNKFIYSDYQSGNPSKGFSPIGILPTDLLAKILALNPKAKFAGVSKAWKTAFQSLPLKVTLNQLDRLTPEFCKLFCNVQEVFCRNFDFDQLRNIQALPLKPNIAINIMDYWKLSFSELKRKDIDCFKDTFGKSDYSDSWYVYDPQNPRRALHLAAAHAKNHKLALTLFKPPAATRDATIRIAQMVPGLAMVVDLDLRDDEEFMLVTSKISPHEIAVSSARLNNDWNFLLKAIENNHNVAPWVLVSDGPLIFDPNFILPMVQRNGLALQYAGDFRRSKYIIHAAIDQNYKAVQFASRVWSWKILAAKFRLFLVDPVKQRLGFLLHKLAFGAKYLMYQFKSLTNNT